jgi:hypothetical protein
MNPFVVSDLQIKKKVYEQDRKMWKFLKYLSFNFYKYQKSKKPEANV